MRLETASFLYEKILRKKNEQKEDRSSVSSDR